MKFRLTMLSAAALALTMPAAAQGPEMAASAWTVDHSRSRLGFNAVAQGAPFSGQFGAWNADIRFDPANLPASSAEVTITMTSADTGDASRDTSLPGADWFAADVYEAATFKTTSITSTGGNSYVAEGVLGIRDVGLPVSLPFELTIDGDRALMTGKLTINRTDFGIGSGAWSDDKTVGHAVEIDVRVVATKAD